MKPNLRFEDSSKRINDAPVSVEELDKYNMDKDFYSSSPKIKDSLDLESYNDKDFLAMFDEVLCKAPLTKNIPFESLQKSSLNDLASFNFEDLMDAKHKEKPLSHHQSDDRFFTLNQDG